MPNLLKDTLETIRHLCFDDEGEEIASEVITEIDASLEEYENDNIGIIEVKEDGDELELYIDGYYIQNINPKLLTKEALYQLKGE